MATKKQSGQKANKVALTEKALEMKKAGLSYTQIANRLGIGRSTAHKYITEELNKLAAMNRDKAEALRELQNERLEKLLVVTMTKATGGDMGAVEKARRIIDSITNLYGANAPTKIAPTTPDGKEQYNPDAMSPEERRKRIEELQRKLGK
jgi:DNA-binding CsgD family transcriptional regulator